MGWLEGPLELVKKIKEKMPFRICGGMHKKQNRKTLKIRGLGGHGIEDSVITRMANWASASKVFAGFNPLEIEGQL